jgi:hypothetical protein
MSPHKLQRLRPTKHRLKRLLLEQQRPAALRGHRSRFQANPAMDNVSPKYTPTNIDSTHRRGHFKPKNTQNNGAFDWRVAKSGTFRKALRSTRKAPKTLSGSPIQWDLHNLCDQRGPTKRSHFLGTAAMRARLKTGGLTRPLCQTFAIGADAVDKKRTMPAFLRGMQTAGIVLHV